MPRPKRHKIQANKDSLNHLLQEIYNECTVQMSDAKNHRNKILKEIEELEDISMVGKITVDLLKIIDLAIDKKLALAKLQIGLLNSDGSNGSTGSGEITSDQRKFLRDQIKKIREDVDVDIEPTKSE